MHTRERHSRKTFAGSLNVDFMADSRTIREVNRFYVRQAYHFQIACVLCSSVRRLSQPAVPSMLRQSKTRSALYWIDQRLQSQGGRLEMSGRDGLPENGGQNAPKQPGICCGLAHPRRPCSHRRRRRAPQGRSRGRGRAEHEGSRVLNESRPEIGRDCEANTRASEGLKRLLAQSNRPDNPGFANPRYGDIKC